MRKINVYYLVYGLTSGGIEKYSINLFKHLDRSYIDLDFITRLDCEEFFDKELYKAGGKKIPIARGIESKGIFYKIQYLINAFKIVNKKYDIAYFNLSSPSAVFKYPLICRLKGIKKIIIHSHNSYEESVIFLKRIINFIGRIYINLIASEKFACSDKAAEWMFGKKVVKKSEYTYIKNGLDVSKYIYNNYIREQYRNFFNILQDDLVIGHIGRFVKQKNHKFLIDVFAEVLKLRKNIWLVLIGVGELETEIISYIAEKGMINKVLVLGQRSDISNLLQMLDVFVLPSLYEGLPIVGIEAQAAGLPCFFSDTISKEVDITGNVIFLPLLMSDWVNWLLKVVKIERKDMTETIRKAGYDMEATAEIIQKKLCKLVTEFDREN